MRIPVRVFLVSAAMVLAVGGCATQPPPPPEPESSSAGPPGSSSPQNPTATTPTPPTPPTSIAPSASPAIPASTADGTQPPVQSAAVPTIAKTADGRGGTGAGSNGGTGSAVGTTPAATVGKGSSGARAGAAVDGASTGRSGVVVAASRTSGGGGASAEGASGGSAGSAVPPANAKTPEERRAALDKQLNDSLGSFDARLRKEQEKIAQERDARQATVAASTTTDGAAKPGTDQTADAAGSTATEVPAKPSESHGGRVSKRSDTRSPHAGDLKSDKTGGANGSTNGNGALGNVIPDGNDDDIVARRLRKAAEQETDPELKDKLWKEYVEYKKNAQVE